MKKRGNSRKAQITLFMLIGVVILAGGALTFHAVQLQTELQLERKADEISQQLLKTTALEEYVSLCLKEATEKGIKLLGEQGGVIYKSQNGTTPDYGYPLPYGLFSLENLVREEGEDNSGNIIDVDTYYDVSYSIKRPQLSPASPLHKPPPDYPYPGKVYPPQPEHLKNFNFGKLTLKPLCDPKGPNRPGVVLHRSCETYGPPKSIQEELRDYVKKNLAGCVDFQSLSDIMGYNMTEGEVNTNITFTENTIVVEGFYPLSITIKDRQVGKIMMFKTELPIRIKIIHEFLNRLLIRESNDLFFNLTRDYRNFTARGRKYWTPGITLSLSRDPCSTCTNILGAPWDDVITIIDEKSTYQGEPFKLSLAIKNRIPVLEFIQTPNPYPQLYDVVVIENSSLNISPIGYDPDDDEVEYKYSAWKADYDEEFIGPNADNVDRVSFDGVNRWENSDAFRQTRREAIIEVGRQDIGFHIVNVSVEDNEGLKDWQEVRVLVNDIPIVDLKGNNMFEDISDNLASIEDPYRLDGSGTVSLFHHGMIYNFIDALETQGVFESGPSPVIFVPEKNANIEGIIPLMFSIEGLHTITLTVSDNMGIGATGIGSETIEVQVKQCLPHDTEEEFIQRKTATYPFNYVEERETNTDYDQFVNENVSFLATHTCCGNDYEPLGAGTECFNSVDYGPITSYSEPKYGVLQFNLHYFYKPSPQSPLIERQNYGQVGISSAYTRNAIFKRTVIAECRGDRGNICDQNPEEYVEQISMCRPTNWESDQEQCKGPPRQLILDRDTSLAPITCKNYEGESFEDLMSEIGIDTYNKYPEPGICDDDYECTAGEGTTTYKPGQRLGDYACQGSCGSGGCGDAINCECADIDTGDGFGNNLNCGATCDQETDHSYSTNPCQYGCTPECGYRYDEVCKEVCLTTEDKPKVGQTYKIRQTECSSDSTVTPVDKSYYCYSGPVCTSTGCSYDTKREIKPGKCGICSGNRPIDVKDCPPQSTLVGDECKYGCVYSTSTNKCRYDNTRDKSCLSYCATEYGPIYGANVVCSSNPTTNLPDETHYCYYGRSCTDAGCSYSGKKTIDPGECGICTSTGLTLYNDPDPDISNNRCLYGSDGACGYSDDEPCEEVCLTTDPTYDARTDCSTSTTIKPLSGPYYCHSGRECTDNGCSYGARETIDPGDCGICSGNLINPDACPPSRLTGNTCYFGCDSGCNSDKQESCKASCLTTENKIGQTYKVGQAGCFSDSTIKSTGTSYYCYSGRQCTDAGCSYTKKEEIKPDECGTCTSGGLDPHITCPGPEINGNFCLYGCTSNCNNHQSVESCEPYRPVSDSCYVRKSGSEGCTDSGCHYNNPELLRDTHCDTCNDASGYKLGQPCGDFGTQSGDDYRYLPGGFLDKCTETTCNIETCQLESWQRGIPREGCVCDNTNCNTVCSNWMGSNLVNTEDIKYRHDRGYCTSGQCRCDYEVKDCSGYPPTIFGGIYRGFCIRSTTNWEPRNIFIN